MGRTNIDIDDDLVEAVMVRHSLPTKREAVDYALRQCAGRPMTIEETLAMQGRYPDFMIEEYPSFDWPEDVEEAPRPRDPR